MLFNKLVNQAVKDRNELLSYGRGKLVANIELDICYLFILPFNGVYIEHPIGYYSYHIYNGNVTREWNSNG